MHTILETLEKHAQLRQLPIIGKVRGHFLVEAMQKYKPQNVLEIGTLIGYSAILMGEHLKEGGKILTIEVNPEMADQARKNISKAGLSAKIKVLTGDARQIIPTLEGPFDLLFLDGEKRQYLTYLKLAEPKLSSGAIVIADNVKRFKTKMPDFLQYISGEHNYQCRTKTTATDALRICRSSNFKQH